MRYSMQSTMRSSRRYPLLKLQKRHGPSSRKPMKELRLSRIDRKSTRLNSVFNLRETIPESKIVRNVLRSLPERFHAKITTIEESKDIDKIPLTELVSNVQTYELGLTRIGKSSKGKSMALKAKSSDTDESLDDEDSKMKSYITRKFKKFMKNANAKGFDKDHKQSSLSRFKNLDKGKKDARDGSQNTVPSRPKCFGCQGFEHVK